MLCLRYEGAGSIRIQVGTLVTRAASPLNLTVYTCIMAKQRDKKQKAVREGGNVKGGTETGKGKRVPTQPPGLGSGKHHAILAKTDECYCGSCSNKRLGNLHIVGTGGIKRK